MGEKMTGHFVIYYLKDGSLKMGELCTGVSCAITSVNPEEGAKILGPYTVEIDRDEKAITREEMFAKAGVGPHPARLLFNAYHPVVEAKPTEQAAPTEQSLKLVAEDGKLLDDEQAA